MPSGTERDPLPEDPQIGIWAWRLIPFFAILLGAVYLLAIRTAEDPRLPFALKSARDDWFVVEVLTGKRM